MRCLQFDETKLVTGSADKTLKVWDLRTNEVLNTLEGHSNFVSCLCMRQDVLVSGSDDTTVRVWNLHA